MFFDRLSCYVLLLIGLSLSVEAQTFNLRSDPYGLLYGEVAWGVEFNANGDYVVFSNSPYNDTLYYSSVCTAQLISAQGSVQNVDRVIDPSHTTYSGWNNCSAKISSGGFLAGGSNFRVDSLDNWIQRPVLFFFDEIGLFEGYVELGPDEESWIGRQAKQTSDGGYVICGETTVDDIQTDAFVIKTNSLGEETWTQTYGGPGLEVATAIDLAIGGGYFLGGGKDLVNNVYKMWVQKLNANGEVIWDKVWGPELENGLPNLTTASDGNVLIGSNWSNGPNFYGRYYIAKLDQEDGSILWSREYGPSGTSNYFFSIKEIESGGDLIAAGNLSDPFNNGVILRTNAAGDSLWMRTYNYADSLAEGGKGFFKDIEPTPDGGFIAVGTAYGIGAADTTLYSQDVWVVKVDSMGCLEPGCHLVTGMQTQITNLRNVLHVYPNPVAVGGQLHLELDLPSSFKAEGQMRLTITDALGRLVQEQQVPPTTRSIPLSLGEGLGVRGLYHLHLSDATRWISGASFVVE